MDRPGDAGIDNCLDLKAVDHHLGGDGGVDLADAADRDHRVLPAQQALPEGQAANLYFTQVLHLPF